MRQLLAYLRADELDALKLDVGVDFFQSGHHNFALLGSGIFLSGSGAFKRQANQHVARRAEVLYLIVGVPHAAQGVAYLIEIGRFFVLHLHHQAASEFNREMQATCGNKKYCCDKGHK